MGLSQTSGSLNGVMITAYGVIKTPFIFSPCTSFGHSDRKKLALTGRHNFVTSIL
jgi:hypothetical protein